MADQHRRPAAGVRRLWPVVAGHALSGVGRAGSITGSAKTRSAKKTRFAKKTAAALGWGGRRERTTVSKKNNEAPVCPTPR
jgi:hypothetical protein